MHPSEGSIWRHEKTGHYYVVLGLCRIEATDEAGVRYKRTLPLPEGLNNPLRLETAHWIRPRAEFLDGRFTEIVELPVVGRDQDLIDRMRGTIARLNCEAVSKNVDIGRLNAEIAELSAGIAFWKAAAKKAAKRLGEVERQRNTLREDRNALVRQCKDLEAQLKHARERESLLAAEVDALRHN